MSGYNEAATLSLISSGVQFVPLLGCKLLTASITRLRRLHWKVFSVSFRASLPPRLSHSRSGWHLEKYLAQFPQYKDSFAVYFVRSDEGARFV